MARTKSGITTKFKTTTRGLDVIQSVYAFAMALGLTDVFIGSKTFLKEVIFGSGAYNDGRALLTGLMFLNVFLLGLRFFWVPRNLATLVSNAAKLTVGKAFDQDQIPLSNLEVAFHLVMIFVHGTLFFLICAEFEYIVFLVSSSLPLNATIFSGYVTMHVCLLLTNAAWIGLIQRREQTLQKNYADEDRPSAGSVWWLNNLICSLIGIAPFAVLASCHADLAQCAVRSNGLSAAIVDVSPVSAQPISTLFQKLFELAQGSGLSFPEPALFWVLVVLLINSLFDLLTTGRYYLFFEDVEWEADADTMVSAKKAAGKK